MKHTLRSTIALGVMLCLCSVAVAQQKTKKESLQEFLDALNGIVGKAAAEKERQEDRSARANAMLKADAVVVVAPVTPVVTQNSPAGVSKLEVINAIADVDLKILTLGNRVGSLERSIAELKETVDMLIEINLKLTALVQEGRTSEEPR